MLDRRLGMRQFLTRALRSLSQVHMTTGDTLSALEHFNESVQLAHTAGELLELARDMDALAELMSTADPLNAVKLSGTAAELRRDHSAVPFPVERARLESWQSAARQRIGDAAYDQAHLEGRTMQLHDALRLFGSALSSAHTTKAQPSALAR